MKILKTGVVLIALLLVGMSMVPVVSAEGSQRVNEFSIEKIDELTNSQNDIIEANYVPVETAYADAKFALIEFVSLGALNDREKWIGATINPKPLLINDINGKLLFYLFSIENNGEKIGEIKIAANKILGGSLISIGPQTQQIDINALKNTLLSNIKTQNGNDVVVLPEIVCYAYPKIGMVAQFTDSVTNDKKTIAVDAYDYSVQIESNAQLKEKNEF